MFQTLSILPYIGCQYSLVGVFKLCYGFPCQLFKVNRIVVCVVVPMVNIVDPIVVKSYWSSFGYDFVFWFWIFISSTNKYIFQSFTLYTYGPPSLEGHMYYHMYSCPNFTSLWLEVEFGNSISTSIYVVRNISWLTIFSSVILHWAAFDYSFCQIVTVMYILVLH